jgi:hypothetical protein
MSEIFPGKYQVMNELAPEIYEALKADIARNGISVPIEIDENGNILDGHHRYRAWSELRKNEPPPTVIKAGLSEEQKVSHARRVNILRRHLSRAEVQELIEEALRKTPDRSDRAVAKDFGVDHKTVGASRKRMRGEFPHPKRKPDPARAEVEAILGGDKKLIQENAQRVANLPAAMKLAMFDAGITAGTTIVMRGDPFGREPPNVERDRAWRQFIAHLTKWGMDAEHASNHVDWLVFHQGWEKPDEWLGEEGNRWRAMCGMRNPSPEFVAEWNAGRALASRCVTPPRHAALSPSAFRSRRLLRPGRPGPRPVSENYFMTRLATADGSSRRSSSGRPLPNKARLSSRHTFPSNFVSPSFWNDTHANF